MTAQIVPFPPRLRVVDDGTVLSAAAQLSDAGERLAQLRRQQDAELAKWDAEARARQERCWANDDPGDGPRAA